MKAQAAQVMIPHCIPATTRCRLHNMQQTAARCAVTGGYVYRGTQKLCRMEHIFCRLLLRRNFYCGIRLTQNAMTPRTISSFGEDRAGELYIAVWRLGTG